MEVMLFLIFIVFVLVMYLKESNKERIIEEDVIEDVYIPETKNFIVGEILFSMIKVEAGTFLFGYDSGNKEQSCYREVTVVNDFYMGELPVTQGLWKSVMGYNNSHFVEFYKKEKDNLPVEGVSWDECVKFTEKLNQMFKPELNGMKFRLPTEIEWEFAAKGGNRTRGFIYSGSNIFDKVSIYDYDYDITRPVASNKPNELGLYDMTGNVWEWCSDLYTEEHKRSWFSQKKEEIRVCRGGSFNQREDDCHVTVRKGREAAYGDNDVGFRLCLS